MLRVRSREIAMRLTIAEGTKSVAGLLLWSAGHVVMEAASGKAVSLLSWVEGRRGYQLWVDANVVRVPLRERLFALAASLPRAVPGCPDEPAPPPLRFDADGNPVDEPLPKVLTQAQMDAIVDKSKRPCK
jgi:hypothetical protein